MVQRKIVIVFILLYLLYIFVDEIPGCTSPDARDFRNSKTDETLLQNWSKSQNDTNLTPTNDLCADDTGRIYEVKDDDGILLYRLCYDEEKNSLIYSWHSPLPTNNTTKTTDTDRPKMLAKYTLHGLALKNMYINQVKTFVEHFGSDQTIVQNNDKFQKCHAVPMSDFRDSDDQKFTMYYHNTYPGYGSINNGNIKSVEYKVRDILLESEGGKLIVYTGLYGILKSNNQSLSLNMKGSVRVPLVVWKLVINPITHAHIVFAVLMDNKPTPNDITEFNEACDCFCKEARFTFDDDPGKGLTRCCTIFDLAKKVPYVLSINKIKEMVYPRRLLPNSAKTQKKSQPHNILVNLRGQETSDSAKDISLGAYLDQMKSNKRENPYNSEQNPPKRTFTLTKLTTENNRPFKK